METNCSPKPPKHLGGVQSPQKAEAPELNKGQTVDSVQQGS